MNPDQGNLYQRSIEIILENQAPSGAYVASPNFPTYHYCWFRDGSFIAYAMDLAGKHASSQRFHNWASARINERRQIVQSAIAKARHGEVLDETGILHTRYRLDGRSGEVHEWPNFQLDGFGTWLWALGEHVRLLGIQRLPEDWQQAADLIASYLSELWSHPCYDCWEEFPDHIHAYTLAAIYGGLRSHTQITGVDHRFRLEEIKSWLLHNAKEYGHFVKFLGSPAVDSSLLGIATPYQVISPDDPRMRATVGQIESKLSQGGGLHRYAEDTYFGGGEWVLLSAWLGWYYCHLAQRDPTYLPLAIEKTRLILCWVADQASGGMQPGSLPEQVPVHLNAPSYYQVWIDRWGEIARPLLWSHAKYIILTQSLQNLTDPPI